MGKDLDLLGEHLDLYPNVMTEIGAVLTELGRQPKRARQFFVPYQDRILFGKDSYKVNEYKTIFGCWKQKMNTLIIIESVMPTGKYMV